MRTRPHLTGVLLCIAGFALLGLASTWSLHVIVEHAKEHGHTLPAPLQRVGGPEGRRHEGRGHVSFFATAGLSVAVRRRGNGSDGLA